MVAGSEGCFSLERMFVLFGAYTAVHLVLILRVRLGTTLPHFGFESLNKLLSWFLFEKGPAVSIHGYQL